MFGFLTQSSLSSYLFIYIISQLTILYLFIDGIDTASGKEKNENRNLACYLIINVWGYEKQ